MAELLFIATVVFVAYVVFVVLGKKNETQETSKVEAIVPIVQEPTPAEPIAEQEVQAEKVAPAIKTPRSKATQTKVKATKAATAPVTEKAEAAQTATPALESAPGDNLKNPKTGEVAKVPASYAFAKRWIKDALVEEGLLDKVYKNNELDDAVNSKIQAAIQQLKALDKYQ
jgi:hypothetical protein